MSTQVNPLLEPFRRVLQQCRELYVSAGRDCAANHPELVRGSPDDFVQLMDDLHKGLLVKVYITICEADRRWRRPEQDLAEVLIEHVWNQRLERGELRNAIHHLSDQAESLKWYSLIRPFEEIAPLRGRIGELETIVMRLANFVAKVDGQLAPGEVIHLKAIQNELDRHLRALPLDEPGQHEKAESIGRQAVQQMKADAKEVRAQCELQGQAAPAEPEKSREQLLAEALAELDALTGMENVKREVHTLVNFLKIQEERARAGLPKTDLTLHMVFSGNPGTGKTTVARIIGRIFGAMGILSKGHLIETDRSGLVAEYAGQTGPKTNKKLDESLDGVLFIDEAYSLVAETGDDPYGNEAVQALLKRMEDDRQRLVVILAGYPKPMERLLKSNPGLSSRFPRKLTFADFTASELGHIFQRMCTNSQYELPALTRAKLLLGFQWLLNRRDEHFGNGRLARNTFETAIRRLANRIADITPLTKELLTVLEVQDIQIRGVPADTWDSLEDEDRRFTVACPGCHVPSKMPTTYLGRRVQCKKCQHRFTAEWGEPI